MTLIDISQHSSDYAPGSEFKISLDLSTDERIALGRLMAEHGVDTPELAADVALRDWCIGCGYLELEHELDEDTVTMGAA